MDKYVIKRIKITYGLFTSLLLVGLLCLAFCSLLLVYSSDNIAYADNGVVNNNILYDSDLDGLTGSTTGSKVFVGNYWFLQVGNCSLNDNVFSASSQYSQFSQVVDNYTSYFNTYLTFTVSLSNVVGRVGIVIYSNSNIAVNNNITSDGVYSITGLVPNNSPSFRVVIQNPSNSAISCKINFTKLEVGSSFTGYVPKDYFNYGYNQGVIEGSNSTAYINSGYILDKTVLLSDLENGSTFTINNINYRFQGNTVFDNYFQTNVLNSWPLGANGDTNHRYLGFLIADDLYKFSAIQISIIRDGNGYLYFSGDGLTPKVVDLSSLSPVSSYPFNYLNQSTYMDTYIIYASEFTNVYYLSYLATSFGTAGDTLFFNTINIYSNLDNSSWYDRGIETGKTLGYSEGYNKGYQEGSNYSGIPFYNMFGAIFDVPVQTINGLLDFNILGVNMKGFILGLISLCIILFILKIVFK